MLTVCWQSSFLLGMFLVYSRATWSCSWWCYCDVWNRGGLFNAQHEESWHNSHRLKNNKAVCRQGSNTRTLLSLKHICLLKKSACGIQALFLSHSFAEVGRVLHSHANVISLIREADWKKHKVCTAWNNSWGKSDSFIYTLLWRSLKCGDLEWFFSVMVSGLIWWWPCAAPG